MRIPASICGLVGYKPTIGLIGRDRAPRWIAFSTSGATERVRRGRRARGVGARRADRHRRQRAARRVPSPLEPAPPTRVIACRTLRADVDPAVEAAFDATLAAIEDDLGMPVTRRRRGVRRRRRCRSTGSRSARPSSRSRWPAPRTAGTSSSRASPSTLRFGSEREHRRLHRRAAARATTRPRRSRPCSDDDAVLVTPTCNVTSWAPSGPLPSTRPARCANDLVIAVNTVELNFTGHPGVSVPIGTSPRACPIGMQIAAPRFGDRLALGLAAALEAARRGRAPRLTTNRSRSRTRRGGPRPRLSRGVRGPGASGRWVLRRRIGARHAPPGAAG